MEPVGLRRGRKHDQIEHRCTRCGALRVNRVARATDQPDSLDALIALSLSAPDRGRGR